MGNENLGNGKVDQKKSIGIESTSKQSKIKLNMSVVFIRKQQTSNLLNSQTSEVAQPIRCLPHSFNIAIG